jgi:hypothetical protein
LNDQIVYVFAGNRDILNIWFCLVFPLCEGKKNSLKIISFSSPIFDDADDVFLADVVVVVADVVILI